MSLGSGALGLARGAFAGGGGGAAAAGAAGAAGNVSQFGPAASSWMANAATAPVQAGTAASGAFVGTTGTAATGAAAGFSLAGTALAALASVALAAGAAFVLLEGVFGLLRPFVTQVTQALGKLGEAYDTILAGPMGQLGASLMKLMSSLAPVGELVLVFGAALFSIPFALFTALIGIAGGALVLAGSYAGELAGQLGAMSQALAGAANGISSFIDTIMSALARLVGRGGKKVLEPGSPLDAPEVHPEGDYGDSYQIPGATALAAAGKKGGKSPHKGGGGGGGKNEIVIKFELGDGNEDALFVRTQKQIRDTLVNASRAVPLGGRMVGAL